MEEVADVTITDNNKPSGNSGEFKLRPVKQITESLIAKMKRELVQELLMVLLPVYIFFHSFTKVFQVDSLGDFNAFIKNATQRKQNLEGYIAAREQVARADEKLAAIKLQDTKTLFMKSDETIRINEWEADE